MLPAFHVDGDLHDIPHPYEGSRVYEAYNSKHVLVLTRLSQSVSSLVTTTISYGESQKRNLPSFCPGTSCANTVWEKQHASAAVSPKKRALIAVLIWFLLLADRLVGKRDHDGGVEPG